MCSALKKSNTQERVQHGEVPSPYINDVCRQATKVKITRTRHQNVCTAASLETNSSLPPSPCPAASLDKGPCPFCCFSVSTSSHHPPQHDSRLCSSAGPHASDVIKNGCTPARHRFHTTGMRVMQALPDGIRPRHAVAHSNNNSALVVFSTHMLGSKIPYAHRQPGCTHLTHSSVQATSNIPAQAPAITMLLHTPDIKGDIKEKNTIQPAK